MGMIGIESLTESVYDSFFWPFLLSRKSDFGLVLFLLIFYMSVKPQQFPPILLSRARKKGMGKSSVV